MRFALIAIFGAAGALARVCITQLSAGILQIGNVLATLGINVMGCFLMGLVCAVGTAQLRVNQDLHYALVSGFLGGFTTFSSFSFDFVVLFKEGRPFVAFLYLLASVGGGIATTALGFFIGSLTKGS